MTHAHALAQLVSWVSTSANNEEVVEAKKQYLDRVGAPFEEEAMFESRMDAFLEHFVCDRPLRAEGITPAMLHYRQALVQGPASLAQDFAVLIATRYGLYEVEKIRAGSVSLRALVSGLPFTVTERRGVVGLNVGAVLECRLIPHGGTYLFSNTWCVHPQGAEAPIRKRVVELLKPTGRFDEEALVADCANRALKAGRYRQITIDKIYDFHARRF